MITHKSVKDKGKLSFTKFFQKFSPGDSVAVAKELSLPFSYSDRIQGRTGKIIGPRGSAYYVEIKELNKPKKYLIRPIHLKKIQDIK